MNWILKTFILRFRLCARRPFFWVFILIAVALAMTPLFQEPAGSKLAVGVVLEDQGSQGRELVRLLQGHREYDILVLPRETALDRLKAGKLEAVFVVKENFSRQIERGEFANTVAMYTSPASSAAASISEALITNTLDLWIEKDAVIETRAIMSDWGLSLSEEEIAALRDEIRTVYYNSSFVVVNTYMPLPQKAAERPYQVLVDSVCIYAAFSIFALFIGATWMIENRKLALGLRFAHMGIKPWQGILGDILAPMSMCLLGGLLAVITCSAIGGIPLLVGLGALIPLLLYFTAGAGMLLAVTAFVQNNMQLMLLAPVLTLINASLSGMLFKLPDWAALLEYGSMILPGRWLWLGTNTGGGPLLGMAVCAAAWMSAGLLVSAWRNRAALIS
ncbi:MAG: ABC transporter permease [Firmicutes bacterium]|nr:ABC transporter permease [Bacillota bacterium]